MEPYLAPRLRHLDQRALTQLLQVLKGPRFVADGFSCFHGPAAAEDGELSEKLLQFRREKLVAPVQSSAQAAVAWVGWPLSPHQQLEPLLQAREHLLRPQH